jgi:hypothetical protein
MDWMAQISHLISTTIVRLCKIAMDAVGSSFFSGGFSLLTVERQPVVKTTATFRSELSDG